MIITKTKIQGVFVLDVEPRTDPRGYFTRVFAKEELKKEGIVFDIVHVNRSLTREIGTIRGIHYQKAPKGEDKIIQCLQGSIFDVAVDTRRDSPTFRKWFGVSITAENKKMLLVPKGCAHAFQTLDNDCLVEYFTTQYYSPEHEVGIRWNDSVLGIDWPILDAKASEKDENWPDFK